jgi:Ankyrin repeats (3 copies)
MLAVSGNGLHFGFNGKKSVVLENQAPPQGLVDNFFLAAAQAEQAAAAHLASSLPADIPLQPLSSKWTSAAASFNTLQPAARTALPPQQQGSSMQQPFVVQQQQHQQPFTVQQAQAAAPAAAVKGKKRKMLPEGGTSPSKGEGSAWSALCTRSKSDEMTPHEYLIRMLAKRGYPTVTVSALTSVHARSPTAQQVQDYTLEVVNAVRGSDMVSLRALQTAGVSMNACNRFGESILHMAARMGALEMVEFMVAATGSEVGGLCISDDYGRLPLHDACW